MSSSSQESDASEDEDFVVHAVKAKDGTVEVPLLSAAPQPSGSILGTAYSASPPSSPESPFSGPKNKSLIPPNMKPPSSGNSVNNANLEEAGEKPPVARKRLRFADDVKDAQPEAKKPALTKDERKNGDEEDLDGEMALFEAEVGALNDDGEGADVDLAEIEDEREEAFQDELRTRVKRMRERLNGVSSGDEKPAAVKIAGEVVRLKLREKAESLDREEASTKEYEKGYAEIDLLADWTEFTG